MSRRKPPTTQVSFDLPTAVVEAALAHHRRSRDPAKQVERSVVRMLTERYINTGTELRVRPAGAPGAHPGSYDEAPAPPQQQPELWAGPPPAQHYPAPGYQPPQQPPADPWQNAPGREPVLRVLRDRWRSNRVITCTACRQQPIRQGDPILVYWQWWARQGREARRFACRDCGVGIERLFYAAQQAQEAIRRAQQHGGGVWMGGGWP